MALRAKHPKKAEPKKPKILVFGDAGVGKTWGALEFQNCYYIDTEGGANLPHYTDKLVKSGGIYMGPEDGANDMELVVRELQSLATTKHDYRTVVIDSYSHLYGTRIAQEYQRMAGAGSRVDMTNTYGAEKKPAVAATKQMLVWLDKLDMTVILICHEAQDWKNKDDKGNVPITFDGYEKLKYILHLVMHVTKQGNSRKAKIGKCRLEQFREGEIIDWGYTPFAERYGREIIESDSKPLVPATAEQIHTIVELAGLTKLDEETRVKWWDKAGVDSWGQMDSTTIQACIDFLLSKLPKAPAVA